MGIITDILKDIPLSTVLREKIVELENKMSILEKENTVLKTDKKELKIKIDQQNNKIEQLNIIISTQKNPSVDDNSKNILILISQQNNNPGLTTEKIAQSLNINLQVTTFHLEELYNNKFISESGGSINIMSGSSSPSSWFLEQEGRRYLIDNKII